MNYKVRDTYSNGRQSFIIWGINYDGRICGTWENGNIGKYFPEILDGMVERLGLVKVVTHEQG